jgi:hypothetical protein
MGIRTVIAAALPALFSDMGEEAVYTPSGGTALGCHIFIDFNVQLQPDGLQAQAWDRATIIECLISEVGSEPNRGDIFVYDGTTYTVQRVMENDGFTVKLAVT